MSYFNFSRITIDDKAVFEKYINKKETLSSDECFSVIFAWRDFFDLRYIEINGYLCIISTTDKIPKFAFSPLGEYEEQRFSETIVYLKNYFEGNQWSLRFRLVPENKLERFKKLSIYKIECKIQNGFSDYVYLAEDFINLGGSKFEDKRRQINWFRKNCLYECVAVGEDEIPECFTVLEKWYCERESNDIVSFWEKNADIEMLSNFIKLGYKATLVRVDGAPKAFVITELLNEETVVSLVEKADKSIKGIYAYLNQVHYKNEYPDIKYINLEEDMGSEGLKKSKLSYHPVNYVHKYEINLI